MNRDISFANRDIGFKNDMAIDCIEFVHKIKCFCPLGQSYCTYQISVDFVPHTIIPDYMVIQGFLNSLTGDKLTMEDCVGVVFKWLYEVYEPLYLQVVNYCDDANHFPARVTKKL